MTDDFVTRAQCKVLLRRGYNWHATGSPSCAQSHPCHRVSSRLVHLLSVILLQRAQRAQQLVDEQILVRRHR